MSAKKKHCRVCGDEYQPRAPLQRACSPKCALEFVHASNAKRARLEFYRRDKGRLKARAQAVFNRYIRARDFGKPCISCGSLSASAYHAGHYISVGARPQLRFNEDNCNLQCSKCNTHLSGNLALYRVGLVKKIGSERVEYLEGPHPAVRYREADYQGVIDTYTKALKALKSSAEKL